MAYTGLKRLLLTTAILTQAIPFYAGCTQKTPDAEQARPTQQAVAAPPLEERVAISDMLEIYTASLPKALEAYQKMNKNMEDFAKNSNISVGEVTDEDRQMIRAIYLRELETIPDFKRLVSLGTEEKQELGALVAQKLEIGKARRLRGEFYTTINGSLDYYHDPNLLLAKEPDTAGISTIAIENPLVWTNQQGFEVVEIGKGYLTSFGHFGTRPGPWAREVIENAISSNLRALQSLKAIIGKIKNGTPPADLEKIISQDANQDLNSYLNSSAFMRNGEQQITYDRLNFAEEDLNERIAYGRSRLAR